MGTKRSCTIGAVVRSHGPYTHQGNAGNKNQKEKIQEKHWQAKQYKEATS